MQYWNHHWTLHQVVLSAYSGSVPVMAQCNPTQTYATTDTFSWCTIEDGHTWHDTRRLIHVVQPSVVRLMHSTGKDNHWTMNIICWDNVCMQQHSSALFIVSVRLCVLSRGVGRLYETSMSLLQCCCSSIWRKNQAILPGVGRFRLVRKQNCSNMHALTNIPIEKHVLVYVKMSNHMHKLYRTSQ